MAEEQDEAELANAHERSSDRTSPSARELALRAELLRVRHELRALLDDLERMKREPAHPVQSAVVTAVVSRTVLIQHARRD